MHTIEELESAAEQAWQRYKIADDVAKRAQTVWLSLLGEVGMARKNAAIELEVHKRLAAKEAK